MSLLKKINLNNLKLIFNNERFIFYFCLTIFMVGLFCWQIFTPEIVRNQILHISFLILSVTLPLLLAVREKLKFLFFAVITFTAISIFVYSIKNSTFDGSTILKHDWDIFVFNLPGIILLFLFLLILRSGLPDTVKKITVCLFAVIVSLPLLCYLSFNFERMINAYHVALLMDDTWNSFWCNQMVRSALIGFGVRLIILIICVFTMQFPFPALKFRCNLTVLTFVLFTALCWIYCYRSHYILPESLSSDWVIKIKGAFKGRTNPLADGSYEVKNDGVPGLYFLVVGESHEYKSACQVLLNRETFFKSIHNDPRHFVFKNVPWLADADGESLGYQSTSEANVCNMMSLAKQPLSVPALANEPDFLDVMQLLKYKSLFIHNVGPYLSFNIVMHTMFQRADYKHITDWSYYGGKYRESGFQVDNELPGTLQRMYNENIFDKKQSFTVIKPLGLHKGNIIIPEDFARKHKDMDEQELGLLYYDEILAKIISVLRSFPETRAIVYCSDHGEPDDDCGNGVVMFVYLSDELQKLRPELAGKIKKLSEEKFFNIHIDRLLFEIMDISVSKK